MKRISISLDVYSFDELSEEGRERAINDYVEFLMDTADINSPECDPDLKRAILQADRMQTPWFTESYIWEYCEKWILEDLRNPEQFYLKSGEVAISGGEPVLGIGGKLSMPEKVQS